MKMERQRRSNDGKKYKERRKLFEENDGGEIVMQ